MGGGQDLASVARNNLYMFDGHIIDFFLFRWILSTFQTCRQSLLYVYLENTEASSLRRL